METRTKGWTEHTCGACGGGGVVSVYSAFDFEGPGDCPDCHGGGTYWVSPQGRTALYPGGPFTGSNPRKPTAAAQFRQLVKFGKDKAP